MTKNKIKFLSLFIALERDLIVGGQAVMEGVMMRTPSAYAIAVRRKNGSIVSTAERMPKLSDKYPLLKLPFVRGGATLIQSMALGVKALNFSANVAHEDLELEQTKIKVQEFQLAPASGTTDFENFTKARIKKFAPQTNETKQKKMRQSASTIGSILFALGFNVLLFIVAPLLLTNILFIAAGWAIAPNVSADESVWQTVYAYLWSVKPASWLFFNFVDGLIRMAFFVAMIFSFSRLKDVRRVFEYHGAEHKTVFAWENNLALTVKNARAQRRQHPRCGTSFLMVVMLVSIVLFSLIKFDAVWLNLIARILLLPIVAGISYEIIRFAARKETSAVFKFITLPGIWLQNITTQEPDDEQLEVALEALNESLKLEPKNA
jgi:uncharacterized protein YqhQ